MTMYRRGEIVTAAEARLEDDKFGAGISQLHSEAELAMEDAYRRREDEDARVNHFDTNGNYTDTGKSTSFGTARGGVVVHKPEFTGHVQPLLETQDFEELVDDARVGVDNRVYKTRQGLIGCLAPAPLPPNNPGQVYVETIDWKKFPPMVHLSHLFREFFSRYDREVLMIVGYKRDGTGWRYHVPRQVGSPCLVKWSADDHEMNEFSQECQWIGTIHIHPGHLCTPSKTDIDDWAEPEKSGLHIIFGRDGSFTIQGAIAGRVFELETGKLDLTTVMRCEWTTSHNLPLPALLLIPAPVKVKATRCRDKHKPDGTKHKWKDGTELPSDVSHLNEIESDRLLGEDYLRTALDCSGAFRCNLKEFRNLRVVIHKDHLYLLTPDAVLELETWCDGEAKMPKLRPILIKLAKPSEDAREGTVL